MKRQFMKRFLFGSIPHSPSLVANVHQFISICMRSVHWKPQLSCAFRHILFHFVFVSRFQTFAVRYIFSEINGLGATSKVDERRTNFCIVGFGVFIKLASRTKPPSFECNYSMMCFYIQIFWLSS